MIKKNSILDKKKRKNPEKMTGTIIEYKQRHKIILTTCCLSFLHTFDY